MAAGSQPGDLAYAKGKLYVVGGVRLSAGDRDRRRRDGRGAEADRDAGRVASTPRARERRREPRLGRPLRDRHGRPSSTRQTDTLLGAWDTDPTTTNGRAHAGVFSKDGQTLYVASDATGKLIALDPRTGELLWSADVPNAHELAVTHDGKTAYVTGRVAQHAADRRPRAARGRRATSSLGSNTLPDTLQLSANEKLLTVGLRGTPAQVAIIDTATFDYDIVTIGGPGTIAGHQWTSPNGHFTFAAFEGPGAGVAVIDHEQGNAIVQTLDYPGRPHGVDFARP